MGGSIVRVATSAVVPTFPVIVADFWEETPDVLTVNVALDSPAGTVTLGGTVTPGKPLVR
jgi:hypothetical protein